MKKYLRWQGFLGFIAVIALLAAFIYVFAGFLIKLSIEKGGGWYLGAEVNLEEVKVNWSPFKINLIGFQATDPNMPELNAMQFKQANAELNLWQYMLGKVIIEDLTLEGLQFGAERDTKGEVYRSPEDSASDSAKDAIESVTGEIKLPDPKQLLKDSNLITVAKAEQLQSVYDSEKQQLTELKNNLPNEDRIEFYKAKVKEIQDTKIKTAEDLVKLKARLDELKQEIKADKVLVNQAKETLSTSKSNISKAVSELKQAPEQDWQAVKTKYQLDSFEAEDVAHIIFGEKGREYYNQATDIYQMLKPFLQSEPSEDEEQLMDIGQYIHFSEADPQPDWLIKQGQLSVITPQGQFTLDLTEINMQHWKRNQASLIQVSSNQLAGEGSLKGKIDFFNTKTGDLLSEGQWLLQQLPIGTGTATKNTQDNPVKPSAFELAAANLFADGQFKLNNSDLDANIKLDLLNPVFLSDASKGWQQQIIQALNDTAKIPAEINLTGNALLPKWQIHSQIDEIIKQSVTQQVDAKLTEFKTDLQTQLNEKVASTLKVNQEQAGQIANLDTWLTNADNALTDLLETQLKSVLEQEKEQAKDKLKDKAKDKLKGLFGG